MTASKTLYETLAHAAAAAGFDLAAAGRVGDYNRTVEAALQLPDFGREDALVVVFGNTRALWSPFLDALERDAALCNAADPLDLWTERTLGAIAASHLAPQHFALRFAHEAPPRRIAIQRLADAVGLAQLGPAMLCVDAVHGPWIGLRAALVIDAPGLAPAADAPRPCDVCVGQPCVAALAALVAAAPTGLWPWVALRDACPVGTAHRYGPHQLRYHYLKDRDMLRRDR